ncbi:MAG: tripartite tricarboxylate transporter TctB family protein [Propioniciclava sp.]|uniref:tripartite tricarboxylate transporter TctB family protein n=1 Tax=Propioniciclava sp. TaxID=2038686 RepID=UPI0039E6B283
MGAVDPADAGAAEETGFAAPASPRLELLIGVVALVAAGAVLALSTQITSRVDAGGLHPKDWPTLLSGLAIALAIGLLIKAKAGRPQEREGVNLATRAGQTQVGLVVLASIVFLLLWAYVNFVLACAVFLVGTLFIFGVRSPLWLVAFPAGITGLIYVLFRVLLRVPL